MARRKPKYNPLAFDRGEDWVPPYLKEQQEREAEEQSRPQPPVAPPKPTPAPVAPPQGGYWSDRVGDLRNIGDQLGAAGNLIGAGWSSIGANAEGAALRKKASLPPEEIAAAEARARELTELASRAPESVSLGLISQANDIYAQINETKQIQADPQGAAIAMQQNQSLRDSIAKTQEQASQVLDRNDPSHILKITAGLVGDPTQLGPIAGGLIGGVAGAAGTGGIGAPAGAYIGGTVGSLPMIKTQHDMALNRAMDKGLPYKEANQFAAWVAGSGFAIQALTGGIAGKAGMAKGPIVDSLLATWAKQTGKVGLIGAAGNLATVEVQNVGNAAIARNSTGTMRQVASEEVPQTAVELFKQAYDASLGGFVAGAGLAAAPHAFQMQAEKGRQVARINRAQDRNTRKPMPTEQPSLFRENIHPPIREGEVDVMTVRPTPTEQDVARLNTINQEIVNLQERVDTGKASTDQKNRLLSLKAARTRLVGLEKPRVVNDQLVEPGLNLEYPVQPLKPEFTGLETGVRETAPLPETPIPANVVEQSISQGGVQSVKKTPQGAIPANKTPSAKASKKAAPAPVAKGRTAADDIAALRAGLKQEGEQTTDTTPDEIYNHLREQKGSRGTALMSHLLDKDNVRVVANENEIPAGAEKIGAAGFYDGKRTYIVADQIPKKNMTGAILNVAAHELHHAANRSGKITMRGFVGDKEIDSLNAKIREAAKNGNKNAQVALSRAAAADRANPGSAREELVPYLINQIRKQRDNSPMIKNIVGDLISTVKDKTGMEVSLGDVGYLSERLLDQAARSTDRLSDSKSGRGNAMIFDRRATGFNQAAREGLTYTSKDTLSKFVKSDADSKIKPEGLQQMHSNKPVRLEDVLDHPVLYEQHPEMADRLVYTENFKNKTQFGQSDPDGSVTVSREFLKGDRFNDVTLREALLHEVQHQLQGDHPLRKQDFFNRDAALSDADKKILAAYDFAAKENDKAIDKLLTRGVSLASLIRDTGARRAAVSALKDTNLTPSSRVGELIGYLEREDAILTPGQEKLIATFKATRAAHNKLVPAKRAIDEKAGHAYQRNITEAEAFFTQDNADVPESKLPINPEQNFREEGLDVPTNDRMERLAAGREKPEGLAMNKADLEDIVKETAPDMRNATTLLEKTFMPGGIGSDELRGIVHAAGGKQGEIMAENAVRVTRIWDAVHENVKTKNITEADLIAELDATIEKANAEPNRDTRQSIIASLDRKYPGLGRAQNEYRAFKNRLTEAYIAQRIRDNEKPLTDKEKAVFAKMIENEERYTTRAYLATLGGEVSKSYARSLMKEFNADPTSESGRRVQEAVDFLIDKQLAVPDRETLEGMDVASLKRMYQTWMNKTPKVKGEKAKAKMVEELSNLPEKTQAELRDKALEVIRSLLGLTEDTSAVATYLRGGKQNRTILEGRKDVPPEIRNLLGEITHPIVREMMSVVRLSSLIHKTQSLTDIFETMKGKEWSDTTSEQFPNHLSGEAYGPMDGKFVSHRLAGLLKDSAIYRTTIEQDIKAAMLDPALITGKLAAPIIKTFRGVSTAQKTASLVLSPMAMLYNAAFSWSMALGNGVVNPMTYYRGLHDTAVALHSAVSHRQSDKGLSITKELQLGKVLDSATVGQWQSDMYKDMFDKISRLDPTKKNFKSDVIRTFKETYHKYPQKGLNYARSLYAFMDVWAKVAGYYDKKAYLSKMNELEGWGWSDEQLIQKAGYETSKTNISYDMAIPIFRLLERNFTPVFMFATFTSETFRAHAQSYMQVFRDIGRAQNAKTAEARTLAQKAALKRLTGTLVTEIGLNALFRSLIDGEDEKEKRKRQLDAPWEKYDVLVPIGINKDGNEHMLGLSRFDPIGPYNELERALVMAKTPEEERAAMKQAVTQFFIQSRSAAAFAHVIGDIVAASIGKPELDKRRKKNTVLEKEWPAAYDALVNGLEAGDLGENLAEALDTVTPGILRPLMDPHANDIVKVRPGDQSWMSPAMKYLGGKPYVRDPDKSMTFRVIDYTKGMEALKKEQKEFLDKQYKLDPDAILEKLQSLKEKEDLLQDDLHKAYDGYLAFDKTPQEINATLKNARLTSVARANLLTGRRKSELTNTSSLVRWYKQSLKEAKPEERDDIKARYRLLKKIYTEENN